MKHTTYKTVLFLTILIITLNSFNLLINIQGQSAALVPKIGQKPTIDGKIDTNTNEWENALKTSMTLYHNLSDPINGLKVDFWLLQNDGFLYIAVQVEFEAHSSSEFMDEFVGILISNDNPGDPPVFIDAKILQFSNISSGDFSYGDYYISDSTYHLDDEEANGTGAAGLTGDTSVYEFALPVEVFDPSHQDVYLQHLFNYAFGVVYGDSPSYPEGIILSNYKLVQIQFAEITNPPIDWEAILFILTIVIFVVIGIFYAFFIYRITKLKDKIRRLRS